MRKVIETTGNTIDAAIENALLQLGCIFFSSGVDEALNPRLRTE